MKYRMIRVKMRYMGKPVWRKFYVYENINLITMAVSILSTFNAQFEHMFLFKVGRNVQFVDHRWLDDQFAFGFYESYDYSKYTFKDILKIGEKIVLEYDTGEGYDFDIQVYDNEHDAVFADADNEVILISGKGYGIIENCKDVAEVITSGANLKKYVEEELGLTYNEFLDYSMPINPSEYFDELDIEELQIKIDADIYIAEELREM